MDQPPITSTPLLVTKFRPRMETLLGYLRILLDTFMLQRVTVWLLFTDTGTGVWPTTSIPPTLVKSVLLLVSLVPMVTSSKASLATSKLALTDVVT